MRMSPDGRFLFFSRGGDVYWVDASVLDDARDGTGEPVAPTR